MKILNWKIIFSVFVLSTQISFADIPLAIRAAFKKKFPSAEKVKWESGVGQFEAEFVMEDKTISAIFDDSGNLIETEEQIRMEDIPSHISQNLKNRIGDKKVRELKKVIRSRVMILYKLKIKNQEFLFDETGNQVVQQEDAEHLQESEPAE